MSTGAARSRLTWSRPHNGAAHRNPNAAGHRGRGPPLLPPARAARSDEHAIYLHEIQDPGNLGTILRTLAWFGSFRCLLSPGSVDPYNSKVVRASMGAIFHVPIEVDVELSSLRERFARIACLDMAGGGLQSAGFRRSIATCSATKPAACRASNWRRSMRSRSPLPAPVRSSR